MREMKFLPVTAESLSLRICRVILEVNPGIRRCMNRMNLQQFRTLSLMYYEKENIKQITKVEKDKGYE